MLDGTASIGVLLIWLDSPLWILPGLLWVAGFIAGVMLTRGDTVLSWRC